MPGPFGRDDPRPPGSEKLSAQERYRVRQGSYRIICGIEEAELVVEIVKVRDQADLRRRAAKPISPSPASIRA